MVNEAYALLLNRRKLSTEEEAPWVRHIPDEFVPVQLPGYLQRVRATLLGDKTHWWDITYRVEALLAVLNDSWRRNSCNWMDQRQIGPAVKPASYYADAGVVTPTVVLGDATASVYIDEHLRRTASVPILEEFLIQYSAPDTYTVRNTHTGKSAVYEGTSGRVPVAVSSTVVVMGSPAIGDAWLARLFTRPLPCLSSVMQAIGKLSAADKDMLFSFYNEPDDTIAEALDNYEFMFSRSLYKQDALDAVASSYLLRVRNMGVLV